MTCLGVIYLIHIHCRRGVWPMVLPNEIVYIQIITFKIIYNTWCLMKWFGSHPLNLELNIKRQCGPWTVDWMLFRFCMPPKISAAAAFDLKWTLFQSNLEPFWKLELVQLNRATQVAPVKDTRLAFDWPQWAKTIFLKSWQTLWYKHPPFQFCTPSTILKGIVCVWARTLRIEE